MAKETPRAPTCEQNVRCVVQPLQRSKINTPHDRHTSSWHSIKLPTNQSVLSTSERLAVWHVITTISPKSSYLPIGAHLVVVSMAVPIGHVSETARTALLQQQVDHAVHSLVVPVHTVQFINWACFINVGLAREKDPTHPVVIPQFRYEEASISNAIHVPNRGIAVQQSQALNPI